MNKPKISKILTLSQIHVSEETNGLINRSAEPCLIKRYRLDESKIEVTKAYHNGLTLIIDFRDIEKDYTKDEKIPNDLKDCIKYAKSLDCSIIEMTCYDDKENDNIIDSLSKYI